MKQPKREKKGTDKSRREIIAARGRERKRWIICE